MLRWLNSSAVAPAFRPSKTATPFAESLGTKRHFEAWIKQLANAFENGTLHNDCVLTCLASPNFDGTCSYWLSEFAILFYFSKNIYTYIFLFPFLEPSFSHSSQAL